MKNKILKKIPDLYFLKKDHGGTYTCWLNYEWDYDNYANEITFIRCAHGPRPFFNAQTYNKLKMTLKYYLGRLDAKLLVGYKVIMYET